MAKSNQFIPGFTNLYIENLQGLTLDKNNFMSPRESSLICKHNSTRGIRSISGTLRIYNMGNKRTAYKMDINYKDLKQNIHGVPGTVASDFQIYAVYTSKSRYQVLLFQLFLVFALHLLGISNLQPSLRVSGSNQV